MKKINRITLFLIIFLSLQTNLLSQVPYFVDFKYILNESNAGKSAQNFLQNKLDSGIKDLQNKKNQFKKKKKKLSNKKN